ncbi:putative transport protein [Salmonella enterica subsp. enterica serovar Heidelberg]|nr:putative transport protein [Salmonella enterica subsp. enterica serovar Heidelberg]
MTQIKHERSTQDLVRAAVSGWLGTALEFMDFQLYSLGAALVFHEIFFPEQSAAMALILAMGTYGAGYIARIIGAFVFGKMGDRIGRKKSIVYYYHHDGDLHHADWRTADVCANRHFCASITGDIANYTGAGRRGGNFRRGYHAGRVCAERKAWHHFLAGRDGHQLRYVERDGDLGGDVLCA